MAIIVKKNTQDFLQKYIGEAIHSPEQRLIQGVTALMMQPAIDYYNKSADDDTRAVSVARTIGKIVAGTLVGVGVRYGSIALVRNHSQYLCKHKGKSIIGIIRKSKRDIFTPKVLDVELGTAFRNIQDDHQNFVNGMGTVVATVAMVFTNFLIDAPLTKVITELLTDKVKDKIKNKESGVKNAAES